MQKLNMFGVGPKIFKVMFPCLLVAIVLSIIYKEAFAFIPGGNRMLFYTGLALIVFGVVMYFGSIPFLLKGVKETKLVKSGSFYFCCNPLYASIIVFIVPGFSLMMNSWIIAVTSVIGFIAFKIFIRGEYQVLEQVFGDEYKKYRSETPELFPLPLKKLFHF